MSERAEIVAATEGPIEMAHTGLFSSSPTEMVSQVQVISDTLSAIVDDKHLYTEIGRGNKKRKHVHAEGWTTLGAMLGVFPIVVWTRESPDYQPYIANTTWTKEGNQNRKHIEVIQEGRGFIVSRVEARTGAGVLVGAAEAECGYGEEKWRDSDGYAVRSMAQTRATAKALRLPLGFIMALAGYEATPSDEAPINHVNEGKRLIVDLVDGDKEHALEVWESAKAELGLEEVDDETLTQAQVTEIVETAEKLGGDDDTDTKDAADKAPAKRGGKTGAA